MADRKNKKVNPQLQKSQKAQHVKLFRSKLKAFFVACNKGELYDLIDEINLKALYLMRFHPPQIVLEDNLHLDKKEVQELKTMAHQILKNSNFTIPGTENRLSLYDYFTVVNDARTIIRPTTVASFPGVKRMVAEMQPFNDELFSDEFVDEKWDYVCHILEKCLSQIDSKYYYVNCKIVSQKLLVGNTNFVYRIGAIKSPRIQIMLDGVNRPAFQLGWIVEQQFVPIELNAEQLSLNPLSYPSPIPIYVQSHALVRIKERIDTFEINYYTFTMVNSFGSPEIIKAGKNAYLIAYRILNYKLGYFKADLINGQLIVRTFLFITNSGTPEEMKLRSLTGLQKADYDFLNLGKLSTIVSSDLHKNPQTRALLEKAGFNSLLDYVKSYESKIEHPTNLSERLLNYIHKEEQPLENGLPN